MGVIFFLGVRTLQLNERSGVSVWDVGCRAPILGCGVYGLWYEVQGVGTNKTVKARLWPCLEPFPVRKSSKLCKMFSHLLAGASAPSEV